MVGVAVILLGAGAGVIASTVNPFATGIAAGFAGVSLGDGILWRIIQFVIFEGIAIWYVSAYAARVKKDPRYSVVGIGAGRLHADVGRVQPPDGTAHRHPHRLCRDLPCDDLRRHPL